MAVRNLPRARRARYVPADRSILILVALVLLVALIERDTQRTNLSPAPVAGMQVSA